MRVTMYQKRRLYLSNVVRAGQGELTVEEAFKRKLTSEDEEFFFEAIHDFEQKMQTEARKEAHENPDPNFRGRPEHEVIAATARKNFMLKTSDERKVRVALHEYAKQAAENGTYYPESIYPEIAAELNAAHTQKYAESQAKQDEAQAGTLMNRYRDAMIEDYKHQHGGSKPEAMNALYGTKIPPKEADFESRIAWHKQNGTGLFGTPEQEQVYVENAASPTTEVAPTVQPTQTTPER